MELFKTKVREIIKETSDSYSVKLDIPEGYTWKAGQYTMWQFEDYTVEPGDRPSRVFSIASAMEDGFLMFTTRIGEEHSSWKNIVLKDLRPGDYMKVAKANGSFDVHEYVQNSLAMAGGIGITPIRSLLKHYSVHNIKDHKFTVLYSDNRGEYCYVDDFEKFQEEMPNLKLVFLKSIEDFNKKIEEYVLEKQNDSEYLIAGSPGMNKAVSENLVKLRVKEDNIETDNFIGY